MKAIRVKLYQESALYSSSIDILDEEKMLVDEDKNPVFAI